MTQIEEAYVLREIIERAVATADLTDSQREQAATLFPHWSGNNVVYVVNDYVQYEGVLYRCVNAHTSQEDWAPSLAASLWSRTSDPNEEWPEWIQPTGGHDAYSKDSKVSYEGKHYISNIDGNVWAPPEQWTEVE